MARCWLEAGIDFRSRRKRGQDKKAQGRQGTPPPHPVCSSQAPSKTNKTRLYRQLSNRSNRSIKQIPCFLVSFHFTKPRTLHVNACRHSEVIISKSQSSEEEQPAQGPLHPTTTTPNQGQNGSVDLPQHVVGADQAVVGLQRLEHLQGPEDGGVGHLCVCVCVSCGCVWVMIYVKGIVHPALWLDPIDRASFTSNAAIVAAVCARCGASSHWSQGKTGRRCRCYGRRAEAWTGRDAGPVAAATAAEAAPPPPPVLLVLLGRRPPPSERKAGSLLDLNQLSRRDGLLLMVLLVVVEGSPTLWLRSMGRLLLLLLLLRPKRLRLLLRLLLRVPSPSDGGFILASMDRLEVCLCGVRAERDCRGLNAFDHDLSSASSRAPAV